MDFFEFDVESFHTDEIINEENFIDECNSYAPRNTNAPSKY